MSASLEALDQRHVWHPYGTQPAALPALVVERAEGVWLRLADGRRVVDGMSSWWCACHGHGHPHIRAAVAAQLEAMPHVMFGGLTHAPAVRLAERLVALTPEGLEHVFFADSGSIAIEVAIKMALQAGRAARRTRLAALRGGYHGDTFGAMALCDPVGGMHELWAGALPSHLFLPRPPAGGLGDPVDPAWVAAVEALFAAHGSELAALVLEPVVQGAGGMWFWSPAHLPVLRELCDRHGVLLVLDEIATGFGRTGALFAADHVGVRPDVMCVGKALTGGTLTLGATLCTPAVAAAISAGEGGALMHGPTFMANPLACAAALASTDLLADGAWHRDVARIEAALAEGLAPARALPGVADVRVLGAIGVVQLDHPVDVARATEAALAEGVWLRPFRDLVYTMPPFVSTPSEVASIARAVLAATRAS
ncbi:MAG: adenosylmethionine-8-amino-7-oxononanoateamino transferase [Solirubrobacterales bacterium]|nr:adenosylmethionine-8-amino-7-oxononanoateamino transferase [Solirubrobacterales bacterium]